MSELTLAGLRVVQEVAARGSFTAAADALGYTQSAVSRQISALEASLGTALFDRVLFDHVRIGTRRHIRQ